MERVGGILILLLMANVVSSWWANGGGQGEQTGGGYGKATANEENVLRARVRSVRDKQARDAASKRTFGERVLVDED